MRMCLGTCVGRNVFIGHVQIAICNLVPSSGCACLDSIFQSSNLIFPVAYNQALVNRTVPPRASETKGQLPPLSPDPTYAKRDL